MATNDQITVSVRLDRSTHELLQQAAALDRRSMSNFIGELILRHCAANNIKPQAKRSPGKATP